MAHDEDSTAPQASTGAASSSPHDVQESTGAAPEVVRARSRRREQLLDAAETALRADGPDVAMEAVAARAGVTKPILYRHFGDRGGLMLAVTRRHTERLIIRLRAALAGEHDPRERIRTTIDTYLAFLERDPELYRATMRLGAVAAGPSGAIDAAQELICDEVEADIQRELERAGLDASAAGTWGTAIVGMTRLVGDRWLGATDATRRELTDRLTELVWRGFRGIVSARD